MYFAVTTWIALFILQAESELGSQLKRNGWKAVQTALLEGEGIRPAAQASAKSSNPEIAYFASALLAELDAGKEGVKNLRTLRLNDEKTSFPVFSFGKLHTWLESVYMVDVNTCEGPPASVLQFSGRLIPDPNMAVSKHTEVDVLEAIDEKGNPIEAKPQSSGYFGKGDELRASGVRYSFDLVMPSATIKHIKRLRLRLRVRCERKRGTIRVEGLARDSGAKQTQGDVELTMVSAARASGGEYVVWLTAKAPENHPWLDPRNIVLVDSKDGHWPQRSYSSLAASGAQTYSLYFRDPGESGIPKALIFPAVTETYVRTFYLEFKEIPVK